MDMILSSGRQAEALLDVFRGHAERIVAISSMDVYRACGVARTARTGPAPAIASDRVLPRPHQTPDLPASTGRDAPTGLRLARRRYDKSR